MRLLVLGVGIAAITVASQVILDALLYGFLIIIVLFLVLLIFCAQGLREMGDRREE